MNGLLVTIAGIALLGAFGLLVYCIATIIVRIIKRR